MFAQPSRSVGIKVKDIAGKEREVELYDGSYVLVIGNSEYSNGWDRLGGVKSDVVAVRSVLEKHGFKVEMDI